MKEPHAWREDFPPRTGAGKRQEEMVVKFSVEETEKEERWRKEAEELRRSNAKAWTEELLDYAEQLRKEMDRVRGSVIGSYDYDALKDARLARRMRWEEEGEEG